MSQRRRVHISGGTYLVIQRSPKRHPFFADSDDYALFEDILQVVLERTWARLHAYCWTAHAAYLALQIEEMSIGCIMQSLNSRYARRRQQRLGQHGHFFDVRYSSVLIDPNAYLPKVVHYIHYVPVIMGLAQSADEFLHTSHRAYLGISHLPWVSSRTALRILNDYDAERVAYRKLMSEPPLRQVVDLLEGGARNTRGILGNPKFVRMIRGRMSYASEITLDQIARNACRLLEVSLDDVRSKSRLRKLSLARAVIGWHARMKGVATLAEVARYVGRDPSTLSQRINLYRKCRSDLFELNSFSRPIPIAPWNQRRTWERHQLAVAGVAKATPSLRQRRTSRTSK